MRLTPRRPIGVLGLWHADPGASRAASRDRWGLTLAEPLLRTMPEPRCPCPAASDPWRSRHCSTPRDSGLSGEPDHAARALDLDRPDGRSTQPPLHQPLVMISLRCSGRGEDTGGWREGGQDFCAAHFTSLAVPRHRACPGDPATRPLPREEGPFAPPTRSGWIAGTSPAMRDGREGLVGVESWIPACAGMTPSVGQYPASRTHLPLDGGGKRSL